jgi:CRISPR-associated protein Cmr2
LVYHGGDDVLALLPANGALKCAAELSDKFKAKMAERGLEASLSAGIAIVHHMDHLQSCLEWARAAEKEAKKQRNSVAVALHTRGGEAMTVSTLWNGSQWNLYSLWDEWIKAFREGLSTGLPYELRHIAREAVSTMLTGDPLREEAKRVIERKKLGDASKREVPKDIQTPDQLEQFSKLLIIARFLAGYPDLPVTGGAK